MIEKEYAQKLSSFGKKFIRYLDYQNNEGDSSPQKKSNSPMLMLENVKNIMDDIAPNATQPSSATNTTATEKQSGVLHCANSFFSKLEIATQSLAGGRQLYANNLLQLITDDVTSMLAEVQSVIKDARGIFRKNR
jgi:hypothetical protein